MKYFVQHPDGSRTEYDNRDRFVIAFNNRLVAAEWPAKTEAEQQWRTVSDVLGLAPAGPETDESRARRHASISVWMPAALPFVLMVFFPMGFLLEDAKRGMRTAVITALLASYLSSTSIVGLYHGIRAARFGLRKGKVGVVVNGIWIVAVVVLAVMAYFSD
jgi:hypothetical protein